VQFQARSKPGGTHNSELGGSTQDARGCSTASICPKVLPASSRWIESCTLCGWRKLEPPPGPHCRPAVPMETVDGRTTFPSTCPAFRFEPPES